MQPYQNNVQDRRGNAIAGAFVQVLTAAGAPATIYSDNGVTVASNPLTTDADGEFVFYASNGEYEIVVTSPLLPTAVRIAPIFLFDPQDAEAGIQAEAIVGLNATTIPDGTVFYAKGRDTANDGGGGTFTYSAASVATADGGIVFTPSAGTGRFFRAGYTVFGFNGTVDAAFWGAKPDNSTDAGAALNAMWAYMKTFITTEGANAVVCRAAMRIQPGRYRVDTSVNFTNAVAWQIHLDMRGAVLIGHTTAKPVIDATAVRGFTVLGGEIHGDQTNTPSCGLLLGPRNTDTCGNSAFTDLKTTGFFSIAAVGNTGSETTYWYNCYFANNQTGADVVAFAGDSANRLGFTSDYTSFRASGVAVSATNNKFFGCHFRNYADGAGLYVEGTRGWEADESCYFLSFSGANVRVRGSTAIRNVGLSLGGLFETTQAPGVDYVVEFLVPNGESTQIQAFKIRAPSPHAKTAFFRLTDPGGGTPGTINLPQADIDIGSSFVSTAVPMFSNCANLSVHGSIKTNNASNVNLAGIAAFNGVVMVDANASMASQAIAGSYSVYGRTDNTVTNYGTHTFQDVPAAVSFTPTVTFATPGDLAPGYSVQTGRIFRFGKLRHFQIALTFTPTYTTSSGEFRIAGLPDASPSAVNMEFGMVVVNINSGWTWPASTTEITPRLPNNSTLLRLYSHGSGIASTVWTTANVPSGTAKNIIISGWYVAA